MTDRLRAQIQESIVFAADGGMAHAKALNVKPKLWIGDFDSSNDALKKDYKDIEVLSFPVEKDMTDGELSVETALKWGATRLILCGAFGGERSDHSFYHLVYALSLAKRGIDVFLTSGKEEAYPFLPGDKNIELPQDSLFSIIGLSDLEGLTIEGAKWPLKDHNVAFGASLTLSNYVQGNLNLKLSGGQALILATPK